jgi:hypothetical protein
MALEAIGVGQRSPRGVPPRLRLGSAAWSRANGGEGRDRTRRERGNPTGRRVAAVRNRMNSDRR